MDVVLLLVVLLGLVLVDEQVLGCLVVGLQVGLGLVYLDLVLLSFHEVLSGIDFDFDYCLHLVGLVDIVFSVLLVVDYFVLEQGYPILFCSMEQHFDVEHLMQHSLESTMKGKSLVSYSSLAFHLQIHLSVLMHLFLVAILL